MRISTWHSSTYHRNARCRHETLLNVTREPASVLRYVHENGIRVYAPVRSALPAVTQYGVEIQEVILERMGWLKQASKRRLPVSRSIFSVTGLYTRRQIGYQGILQDENVALLIVRWNT